jgi:uncharacterized protein YndB with AHSA1/START domain
VRVELTIEIARPLQEVFDYLTDLARLPEWQRSAVESRSDGPLRQGSRIHERRSFMGRDLETEVEVLAFEPPRRLRLRALKAPVKLTIDHVLEERGGGTSLRVTAGGRWWNRGRARSSRATSSGSRSFSRNRGRPSGV